LKKNHYKSGAVMACRNLINEGLKMPLPVPLAEVPRPSALELLYQELNPITNDLVNDWWAENAQAVVAPLATQFASFMNPLQNQVVQNPLPDPQR